SASYIRSGTLAALSAAESVSMESVALPALGTGVGSFPVKDCAKVMFQAIRDFDKAGPSHIKRVKIVLFSARAFNDFHTEFLKIKL
ncbi:MAG TPA: macro domain-containing protein, partial [Candidatus Goldiibacteriota bacterium]|nr:macro domain-containing protein [Candidatus Goldiibacteriota bacterium]